jgi:NADP-dependent 3-hydroxy acid dehydrogenase YdfG
MSSQANLQAQSLFEVKDFAAVVTGGGSGIGLMAAQTLANNGARVYIVGRRLDILQRAAEAYSGNGQILP